MKTSTERVLPLVVSFALAILGSSISLAAAIAPFALA